MAALEPNRLELIEKYEKEGKRDILTAEYHVRHKNGNWLWGQSSFTIINSYGEQGIPKVLLASVDMTERKKAEDEIKRLYAELEESHLREKNLMQEIISKQDYELTQITLQMAERNLCLINLKESIKHLSTKTTKEIRISAIQLIDSINTNLRDNNSWKLFEEQFTRANPNFLNTLSEAEFALSVAEMRVCILIRLGLNTKQMASIMYISERTVETHRLNIRKKLRIEANASLSLFLTHL